MQHGDLKATDATWCCLQVKGVGSTASVLTADVMCGQSVMHIIDTVLLPFNTTQGSTNVTSDVSNAG